MTARSFKLPTEVEMLRLLRIANDNPCLLESFYPLLLQDAGKEMAPEEVVNLIQASIAKDTKGDSPVARKILEDQMPDFLKALCPDWQAVALANAIFLPRRRRDITDEQSALEALKDVVAGTKLRVTFRLDVGNKFQQMTLLQLQHKLEFDIMWLAVAHNQLAVYGEWGTVDRAKDFKVTRMSPADREYFAHALAPIAASVQILPSGY